MITYDKVKRLGEIITELTELYGQLTEELPQFQLINTDNKSELKKIAVKF